MPGSFGLVTGLFGVLVSPPPRPCAVAAPTDPAISTVANKKELACILIAASFQLPLEGMSEARTGSLSPKLSLPERCLRARLGLRSFYRHSDRPPLFRAPSCRPSPIDRNRRVEGAIAEVL